jgi:hypothetical protein
MPKVHTIKNGGFFFIALAIRLLFANDIPCKQSVVMDYSDFGPQVVAYDLIGYEWYQWNSQGPDNPSDFDKIFVVVYKDIGLAIIKKKYPVVKPISDFRYVDFSAAMNFIDSKVIEWNQSKKAASKSNDESAIVLYDDLIQQYKKLKLRIKTSLCN